MMDQFDTATDLEMKDREIAIGRRRVEGPKATGSCLWCGEDVGEGMRWCQGVHCRDMWDAYPSMREGGK